jgi:hypothetical protein
MGASRYARTSDDSDGDGHEATHDATAPDVAGDATTAAGWVVFAV